MTAVNSQKFLIGFWASAILMVLADVVGMSVVFYITPPLCIFFLLIHYNSQKNANHDEISIYIYGILILLQIVYLLFIFLVQQNIEAYIGWGFMLVHQFYIQVFKKEGSRVFQSRKVNWLFITIPVIICFFYIGVKLTKIPDTVFVFSLIYPIHKILMFINALYRPVNDKSYRYVIAGCLCSLLTDFGYTHYVFELKQSFYNIFVIFPYMIAQYFFIVGILLNTDTKNTLLPNRIKRFFQSFFTL